MCVFDGFEFFYLQIQSRQGAVGDFSIVFPWLVVVPSVHICPWWLFRAFRVHLAHSGLNILGNVGPPLKGTGKSVPRGPRAPWFCHRDGLFRLRCSGTAVYLKRLEFRFLCSFSYQCFPLCAMCQAGLWECRSEYSVALPQDTPWGRQAFTYRAGYSV